MRREARILCESPQPAHASDRERRAAPSRCHPL